MKRKRMGWSDDYLQELFGLSTLGTHWYKKGASSVWGGGHLMQSPWGAKQEKLSAVENIEKAQEKGANRQIERA